MRFVLFFYLLLTAGFANSYCGKSKIHVFFANGMFNSKLQAGESYNKLRNIKIGSSSEELEIVFSTEYLAYNTNEFLLNQLFEVARQKSKDIHVNFWNYLGGFSDSPSWFQTMSAALQQEISADEAIKNRDLRKQVQVYKDLLKSPENQILTVAHSQGNFFTNFSFNILNAVENRYRMKMISVATPAGKVFEYGRYVNLRSDCVVNRMPGALPANVENDPSGTCDHAFIKSYMEGGKSGIMFDSIYFNEIIRFSGMSLGLAEPAEAKALSNWLDKFDPEKYKKPLLKHQCLAIRTYFGMHDSRWNDVACEERGQQGFLRSLNDCLSIENVGSKSPSLCPIMFGTTLNTTSGYFEDMSNEASMNNKFSTHAECNWEKSKFVKDDLNQGLITRALKFYEDPWLEVPVNYEILKIN